eukprot:c12309_g1_i1.p1 GENE.c12309_g1_i1~~c12309_g1_i1.p1  ORF type:complete len:550 (+),score=106.89 c12309_g1_i1:321-1970(+)
MRASQEPLWLAVRILRVGSLLDLKQPEVARNGRRPYAVGVFAIPSQQPSWNNPISMQAEFKILQMKSVSDEASLWKCIVAEATKSKNKLKQVGSVKCNLRLVRCDRRQLTSMEPIFNTAVCCTPQPLVKPLSTSSGEMFVTLERGSFTKGNKRAAKNVEIVVTLRDNTATNVEKCFVVSPGHTPKTEYRSSIIYHTNEPQWMEQFHVCFPIAKISNLHLYFELYHVSKSSVPYPFAFTFAHLIDNQHALALDSTDLQLWAIPFPTPNNPIFYLMTDWEGIKLTNELLAVNVRFMHPFVYSHLFTQIPRLGLDCKVVLSLDTFEWRGVCKQWLPTRVATSLPVHTSSTSASDVASSTRTLIAIIKSDVFLAYRVDASLWDMAARAGPSSPVTDLSVSGDPLLSFFLEDAVVVNMDQGRHFKLGVFSWAYALVIEFPSVNEMDRCFRALNEARVSVMKNRLRSLGVDLSKSRPATPKPPDMSHSTINGSHSSQAIAPRPVSLDPKATESLQGRFKAAKSNLEAVRAKQQSVTQVIAKLQAQIAQLNGQPHP